MGRAKDESDSKSQLVIEICNLTKLAIASCAHRNHRYQIKSPFIDWYLVLRVDENAGMDVIRKQYLRLALQLHPDKNKHPKAEIAFKLVSEGYACLSDNARRTAFDLERQNSLCVECSKHPYMTSINPSSQRNAKTRGISDRGSSNQILQRMKDLRARFVEEATVIENCLKAYAASRISKATRKELPIFNPTDYVFQGYPHHTTSCNKSLESFRRFQSKKFVVHV